MKKRYHFPALLLVLAVLLTGCGTPLYELTEEEEDMIVSYAAYAVSLHNTYQKDGLLTTVLADPEEEEEEDPVQEDSGKKDSQDKAQGQNAGAAEETPAESVSLAEAIGHSKDLSVKYSGYTVADHYREGKGYSINAADGKKLLIVGITMKNKSEKTVKVNNVGRQLSFRCTYNGTDTVGAENTFLTSDFATYEGSIKAGKSAKAVLLFSVPESAADKISDKELSLSLVVQGEKKNIKK